MAKKSMQSLLDEMLKGKQGSYNFPKTKAPASTKTYLNMPDYAQMISHSIGQRVIGQALVHDLISGLMPLIMPEANPYMYFGGGSDGPDETQVTSPDDVIFGGTDYDTPDFGTGGGGNLGYDIEFNLGQVSDIRLKENIELVGNSPSGVNIYEFDYKDKNYGNGRYRGVMAQEVPKSSFRGSNGYLRVDYSNLDVDFERIR